MCKVRNILKIYIFFETETTLENLYKNLPVKSIKITENRLKVIVQGELTNLRIVIAYIEYGNKYSSRSVEEECSRNNLVNLMNTDFYFQRV